MDRMSSIELALRNEEAEMNFYLDSARRSKNAVAKALFNTLAADEKEHMNRIRGLHEKLVSNGSWPKDVPIEVKGTNIKEVLAHLERGGADAAVHDGDDLDALRKGAEFEQNGAKFYADLAAACTNPQEAKLFKFLSGIEREHMISIKDSIFFLEDPKGWHAEKERGHLDGA